MKINPPNNGIPPQLSPAEAQAPDHTPAPAPAPASAPGAWPAVSRAELHGPRQPEILQRSLLALLDRASAGLGSLPPASRAACAEMLAADPFLSARLLSCLEQEAK